MFAEQAALIKKDWISMVTAGWAVVQAVSNVDILGRGEISSQ